MPRNNKLKTIEREAGEPLDEIIPRTIEREGTIFGAAVALGVHPNTLKYWLKKNNYSVETAQTAKVIRHA